MAVKVLLQNSATTAAAVAQLKLSQVASQQKANKDGFAIKVDRIQSLGQRTDLIQFP
jgi:hypothetical protein